MKKENNENIIQLDQLVELASTSDMTAETLNKLIREKRINNESSDIICPWKIKTQKRYRRVKSKNSDTK